MRRLVLVLFVALCCCAGSASAYPWPFRPFDKQHPIRGFFGDPRTVYENGILSGAFDGPAFISFHQGVDISAPNGTPIYAVATGTVHYLGAATLNLVTDHDVTFQYFHLIPIVGESQHVKVSKTILGYVQPPYGHVHLTEIDGIHAVNPLQRGHLTPYRDHTTPKVKEVVVRNQSGEVQTPIGLCGRVELDVDAFDPQPMAVPGTYHGLPVSPAFVEWSMQRIGGKMVVPLTTIWDARTTLPGNAQFFKYYGKGTYENSPRFGSQQYSGMPGRYLFLLSGNFDTTSVANGNYQITVRVADIRGNHSTSTQRISILNAKSGTCPGSLPAPPTGSPPTDEPPGDASAGQP
ncbi:MAG: peptidoglycan DD-metalloendopeptidase family protein [Actinomycetota bacterium]